MCRVSGRSLLRSGLIFITSVRHFSSSHSDIFLIMDSEAPLVQTAMEVLARATTSSSVLSFNLTGEPSHSGEAIIIVSVLVLQGS